MDNVVISYVKCLFIKQQLLYFRELYDEPSKGCFGFYTKLSPHLIALNNCKDFIDTVGLFIKDNVDLRQLRKSLTSQLECIKYIRHRICGHIDDLLAEQAVRWTPQILMDTETIRETEKRDYYVAELFAKSIIESTLNSFQKDFSNQTIFKSEIDIMYPPNFREFMTFIGDINEDCISFLEKLSNFLKTSVTFYKNFKDSIPAILEAGEMEFGTKEAKSKRNR